MVRNKSLQNNTYEIRYETNAYTIGALFSFLIFDMHYYRSVFIMHKFTITNTHTTLIILWRE